MSLISCNEYISPANYTHGKKNKRTYTRTFLVISDDAADGFLATENYFSEITGIEHGSYYRTSTEYDYYSYCEEIKLSRDGDDGLNWIITVEYEPAEDGETDPLKKKAVIRWTGVSTEVTCQYDRFGQPILNTAGDLYAEPLMRERSLPVLTVDQNEATYSAYIANMYADTINSNTFLGVPPRHWKVSFIAGTKTEDNDGGTYWQVHYELRFNPLSWDKYVLSQGYQELIPGKGLHTICVNGIPLSKPGLLDQNGRWIDPAKSTAYYFQKHELYNPVPFLWTFRT